MIEHKNNQTNLYSCLNWQPTVCLSDIFIFTNTQWFNNSPSVGHCHIPHYGAIQTTHHLLDIVIFPTMKWFKQLTICQTMSYSPIWSDSNNSPLVIQSYSPLWSDSNNSPSVGHCHIHHYEVLPSCVLPAYQQTNEQYTSKRVIIEPTIIRHLTAINKITTWTTKEK